MLTFEHFIDVVFEVFHPPVVTQVRAQHFLRDAVLRHVDHRVPVLSLEERSNHPVYHLLFHYGAKYSGCDRP